MIACCSVCYEKYINEDGTIDNKRLDKAIEKYIKYVFETRNGKVITKNDVRWCKCDCHKDGIRLMH